VVAGAIDSERCCIVDHAAERVALHFYKQTRRILTCSELTGPWVRNNQADHKNLLECRLCVTTRGRRLELSWPNRNRKPAVVGEHFEDAASVPFRHVSVGYLGFRGVFVAV
jgi:hypothetical protein